MNRIIFYSLLFLLTFNNISCSKDDNEKDDIENNGGGNNGNGNTNKPHKGISFTVSNSIDVDGGYVTGEANATIYNRSDDKITSVRLVVKSQNQSTYEVQSWSEVKGGADAYSKKIYFNKTQSPVLICTYTYGGQKYTEEYSY